MSRPLRSGVQLWPGGTPDYRTWRSAVLRAEDLGADMILGLGAGWYEKGYTVYGYDFGTWKTRFDLLHAGLDRITARLAVLKPAPLRKILILIGGFGVKRTLPAVARHADIWHTYISLDEFHAASARLGDLAAAAGRTGTDIERSVGWVDAASANAFRDAGATTFTTTGIHPTDDGYDFSVFTEMLAWREAQQ